MAESTTNESSKLFSEICRDADPDMDKEDKTAYRFSNGRTFEVDNSTEPEA